MSLWVPISSILLPSSKLDTIARKWTLKVANVATTSQQLSLPASERPRGMDERIVGAWAVRSTKRRKLFSADVKQFVLLDFLMAALFTAILKAALFPAVLMAALLTATLWRLRI